MDTSLEQYDSRRFHYNAAYTMIKGLAPQSLENYQRTMTENARRLKKMERKFFVVGLLQNHLAEKNGECQYTQRFNMHHFLGL